jgi:hypothetical protein
MMLSLALARVSRAVTTFAVAALTLGGCCRGEQRSDGRSFRAPSAEHEPSDTTAKPSASGATGELPSASASAQPTAELPPAIEKRLGLPRRIEKATFDPKGPAFASPALLATHYRKHGVAMGFANETEYVAAAQALVARKDVERFKRKNDSLVFRAPTGEFAVVSGRGVLRTYFVPNDPPRYWERQKAGGSDDEESSRTHGRR